MGPIGVSRCGGRVGHRRCGPLSSWPSTYGFDSLYGQGREAVGQRVAIFELKPFTASDISAYQACFGTHVPVSTVKVDGGATGSQSGEAALDIEAVAGLAPSSSITVYSGPNTVTGPIDTYAAIINARAGTTVLNKVITTSWGQCEGAGGIDPAQQPAETTLFQQATAQGQTMWPHPVTPVRRTATTRPSTTAGTCRWTTPPTNPM